MYNNYNYNNYDYNYNDLQSNTNTSNTFDIYATQPAQPKDDGLMIITIFTFLTVVALLEYIRSE